MQQSCNIIYIYGHICSYIIYMQFFIDYNPLMGGGGSGYRPERRGFSAGGGG